MTRQWPQETEILTSVPEKVLNDQEEPCKNTPKGSHQTLTPQQGEQKTLCFLGSDQGPCQTYMRSSCSLNLGLLLIKFNTCEQGLSGKQFFCFLSSSDSLVILSNNPSQSGNSVASETHWVDCDGEWVSRLHLEKGNLPVLLSVLMGLDLNAGSVALVPCIICNENALRMWDPPLDAEDQLCFEENWQQRTSKVPGIFSHVSLDFWLTNAGSVCCFSSKVDWHVVRTVCALSIQRNTLYFAIRVEFNAFGGITVAALKGLSILRFLLKYNIVIQDLWKKIMHGCLILGCSHTCCEA